MSLTIIDIVVLVILALGAFIGFKRGLVKSVVSLIGLIVAFVIAWIFKNPVSNFMYTNLPFIDFSTSSSVINILIYEFIAFLIILIVCLAILKLVVMATGLIDKIVGLASGLRGVSKILGLVFGLLENYLLVFIVLYALSGIAKLSTKIDESIISSTILNKTPVINEVFKGELSLVKEVSDIKLDLKDEKSNKELFDLMLKYKVITVDTAKKLVSDNKVKIDNAEEIIKKYE